MVKRTFLVLGIFAALTMAVGVAHAQYLAGGATSGNWLAGPPVPSSWVDPFPGCGGCLPLYVPCECPPYPESRTIVKTWSCKIEGPCPPPGAPSVCCGGTGRPNQVLGSLLFLASSIATPFDWLFGGTDGVYGCCPEMGCMGPCGPSYGPLPGAIHGVMNLVTPPTVMFGCFW